MSLVGCPLGQGFGNKMNQTRDFVKVKIELSYDAKLSVFDCFLESCGPFSHSHRVVDG